MEWLISTLTMTGAIVKVVVGFSFIIFIHELGHFLAAKANGVRVDRFAIGFGPRLFGWRRGEGMTVGRRPEYKPEELRARQFGETDYCLNLLPLGGYVKMLGQDDIIIDEKTNDMRIGDDPRAFPNRPVWRRMVVVSAGVVANVVLAAILLIAVFLIGRSDMPPVVGGVPPGSSSFGKLEPGDRIRSVNGWTTDTFNDVITQVAFSEGPVELVLERDGEILSEPVAVMPRYEPTIRLKLLVFEPAGSLRIARDAPAWIGGPPLKKGDQVVSVNGKPVQTPHELRVAFAQSSGREVAFEVQREDKSAPGNSRTIEFQARPSVIMLPNLNADEGARDQASLLGMVPRPRFSEVFAGKPADKAGIKAGDVVLSVGSVYSPVYEEIIAQLRPNAGQVVPVRVLREGQELALEVTPRGGTVGKSDAKIEARFHHFGELEEPVVAKVLPGTPAAALGLPRGARLLTIDGTAVADWYQIGERLLARAGQDVAITYTHAGNEGTGTMHVPDSFLRELDIEPLTGGILSIDGQSEFSIDGPKGTTSKRLDDPTTLPVIMQQFIGKTVRVKFVRSADAQVEEREIAITRENYDPWQLRVMYVPDPEYLSFEPLREPVRAGGVVEAAAMSGREVVKWINLTYITLHQFLIKRNVGAEHMAGPIGMAQVAVERARLGIEELLYFLAFISVNLAVLNFLPLPVLDGGLMVFLIIEALKGKPLNLRTQMIATLVGLAAIICVGLFVTFQDILKLL